MNSLKHWNHNAAYYKWISAQLRGCSTVLDVGCGDGSLAKYLSRPGRTVLGIDPSEDCIMSAEREFCEGARFEVRSFEKFGAAPCSFDAVVFCASLHHMDMETALEKAIGLLRGCGRLAVVGLASPSGLADRMIDVCRVVPCALGSRLHKMRSSEELGLPTSYVFPKMAEVRDAAERLLPGASIRYGLY
ncbi:MAG: methyltransferase domain-containing protein, partial [Oscillospiraceae bacterium]|nr:methyltransferase domain-containing protein [Oscillospiraceae bacterium]